MPMTQRYCRECDKQTWHNSLKDPKADPRCTQCGYPRRSGQKNYGIRKGGKIIMEAKP